MTLSGNGSRRRVELPAARRDLVWLRGENQQLRQPQAADNAAVTHLGSQLENLEDTCLEQGQLLVDTRRLVAQAQAPLLRTAAQRSPSSNSRPPPICTPRTSQASGVGHAQLAHRGQEVGPQAGPWA